MWCVSVCKCVQPPLICYEGLVQHECEHRMRIWKSAFTFHYETQRVIVEQGWQHVLSKLKWSFFPERRDQSPNTRKSAEYSKRSLPVQSRFDLRAILFCQVQVNIATSNLFRGENAKKWKRLVVTLMHRKESKRWCWLQKHVKSSWIEKSLHRFCSTFGISHLFSHSYDLSLLSSLNTYIMIHASDKCLRWIMRCICNNT